ncbi:MAG: potassium channel protein [Myxococcales bacterium]|nr:potassium channel protein [Myxococcales bacterium]
MRPVRFIAALTVPFGLIAFGTLGFHLVEGWSYFESLYMSVITLTTVGFSEVHPLSDTGRAFTMVLSLGGIFALFYAATELIRLIVTGELAAALGRQRMERSLAALKDHLIVCGYGRMGRFVCKEFAAKGMPFVVIEREPEAPDGIGERRPEQGIFLHGDATHDDVLKRAGIERARGLVTVLASDADNLYITMSARFLNEKMNIVSRAENERAEEKLLRAGANRVISPYVIGGHRVAQAVLRPAVVDFLELATRSEHVELQLEETRIAAGSRLAGVVLKDSPLRGLGIVVVAIQKPSGTMRFNPPADVSIEAGDTLVTLGPQPQLDQLEQMARS